MRAVIAPGELVGRDAELAEMTEFCHGPGHYWWWQAGAWAGKSALLSSFVLDPPPGMVVVSFFVTTRVASQDDSGAFTATITSQLEELLGSELPEPAAAGGPTARYLLLLRETASLVHGQGKRLVLVVDGLDEDRGPHVGIPSIASLLPRDCEHGLKVIVASRSGLEIPQDVARSHPLHGPDLARLLTRWQHAEDVRGAAEDELRDLLNGTAAQQDVLGLLTAARGGLTLGDLAELTHLAIGEIRWALGSAAARTSGSDAARALPERADRAYLLTHETLQADAAALIGDQRVSGYRDRLHAWAGTYRSAGWPESTPAYLLGDYFGMLQAAGDTARLITCAADPARHDRMLTLTGGDAAALSEIAAAMDLILSQPDPDLVSMTRLAAHRDQLASRNEHTPPELPVVWARAGEPGRAVALASAITDPERRARTQAEVASTLAAAGLTGEAEALARSIAIPGNRARALAGVVQALAAAGSFERAEAMVGSIPDLHQQKLAMHGLAAALTAAGLAEQARRAAAAAEALDDQAKQVTASTEVPARAAAGGRSAVQNLVRQAESLAKTGQVERARQAADQAETAARSAPSYERDLALSDAARGLAAAGLHDRAEKLARSITSAYAKGLALTEVAKVLAAVGVDARAEALAHAVTDPDERAKALAAVAVALAAAEMAGQARRVAGHAEAVARSADPRSSWALLHATRALAAAGSLDRAMATALSITDPERQAYALTDVAGALAAAGLAEQARQAAARAESAARAVTDPVHHATALAGLGVALAIAGQAAQARQAALRAELAAQSITDPAKKARAQQNVAVAMAAAGLVDQAEKLALSIWTNTDRASALAGIVEALTITGQRLRAQQVARRAETYTNDKRREQARARRPDQESDHWQQAVLLAGAARALATAGLNDRARKAALRAETIARSIRGDETWQSGALAAAVEALAAAGMHDRAETLARSITHPRAHPETLAELAQALATARLYDQAEDLARSIRNTYGDDYQERALTAVAQALAVAGLYDRAEILARSITSPDHSAQALAGIAEALAAAGHPVRARHMSAAALSVSLRMIPLPKNVLPPEALTMAAALLIPAGDPQPTN